MKARFEKIKAPVFYFAAGAFFVRYFDFTQLAVDVGSLFGGIFS